MKTVVIFLACISLIYSCAPNEDISPNSGTDFSKRDSLVENAAQLIEAYYEQADTVDDHIELELKGEVTYEDDDMLIVSFNEILKFGSWHYTQSSICYTKSGDSLVVVHPYLCDNQLLNADFYERDLNYPNRIEGRFVQAVDLTGDGKNEYIFCSNGEIRTSFEKVYTIYRFNTEQYRFERTNLNIASVGTQGECSGTYGEMREYEIIQRRGESIPLIKIHEEKSNCFNLQTNLISSSDSYVVWDEIKGEFVAANAGI